MSLAHELWSSLLALLLAGGALILVCVIWVARRWISSRLNDKDRERQWKTAVRFVLASLSIVGIILFFIAPDDTYLLATVWLTVFTLAALLVLEVLDIEEPEHIVLLRHGFLILQLTLAVQTAQLALNLTIGAFGIPWLGLQPQPPMSDKGERLGSDDEDDGVEDVEMS